MELLFAIFHPKPISRVDNPNDSIGLLKVVPPVRTKRALPANIPCALLTTNRVLFDNDSQIFKV